MFEQAEMMASKRTSDSYSHIKKRSELDTIQISMSQASDSNEKKDKKEGKKMKSRIGFNHMDHELTTDAMKTRENMRHFDTEESLNSS